jgi:hypothetical protein
MLKTTCASIIAAAALVALPAAAQTQSYNAGTSMSSESRGTTGTGDQYMRNQENYTESYQEQGFESRSGNEPASEYSHTRSGDDYGTRSESEHRYSHTRTGDDYGSHSDSEHHYSHGQERWEESEGSRYHMHQQALVPGSSHDAWWASDSLSNQSREGYVGTPYFWDSERYYPDPSMN